MTVILNEVKQAMNIIEQGQLGSKPASTLFLLGKYYRQKEHLDMSHTIDKLHAFMQQNDKKYTPQSNLPPKYSLYFLNLQDYFQLLLSFV